VVGVTFFTVVGVVGFVRGEVVRVVAGVVPATVVVVGRRCVVVVVGAVVVVALLVVVDGVEVGVVVVTEWAALAA
jgi:hypothetical protein